MNLIQSIWKYKCPRCRKGDLYTKPFEFKKAVSMHEHCEHCGLKFEAEPGYFFGAMFISYIWTGFACLTTMAICLLWLKLSVELSFLILCSIVFLGYFKILRISRSMYIHFDVNYDSAWSAKQSSREA